MALKQRFNVEANFSMASMTDIVFLLLIFFMITSTIVIPHSIQVLLPSSQPQAQITTPFTRVTIDANSNFYIATGSNRDTRIEFDEIIPYLQAAYVVGADNFIALFADESVPYREIVRILDVANQNQFRMVLMTRPR
jgi:biopolymer transport protein ExbD